MSKYRLLLARYAQDFVILVAEVVTGLTHLADPWTFQMNLFYPSFYRPTSGDTFLVQFLNAYTLSRYYEKLTANERGL